MGCCSATHFDLSVSHLTFIPMVTITGYQTRTSTQDGSSFFVLELTSDEVEFVCSQTTGRFYATSRKCYMSSTFPEDVCRSMLGKRMRGSVVRTECEEYEFTVPETGEIFTRTHRNEYSPVEQSSMEAAVLGGKALMVNVV
jgi:hypothetical protein